MKKTYLKFPRHSNPWITMPDGKRILRGSARKTVTRVTCFLEKKDADEVAEIISTEVPKKIAEQVTLVKGEMNTHVSKEVKAAEDRIKEEMKVVEKSINDKATEVNKGLMSLADFEKFKTDELAKINEKLAALDKMETAQKAQGEKINEILEKATNGEEKSFEQFFVELCGENGAKLKEMRAGKGDKTIELTPTTMKAAGVSSISGVIQDMSSPPASPYLPGIGGSELLFFNVMRNPNFILNKVDLGRTDQARIAWINEISTEEGLPQEILEGQEKPMISNKFTVEISYAKKIAAYIKITEELEQDVPQIATAVRRLLQERVMRGWDDAIQLAVIAVATAYSAPALNGSIPFANYWDAVYAMLAQVRVDNFFPNSVNIHPYTNVKMQADKTKDGIYLLPPFKEEIQKMITQANKLSVDNALVGDLKQYKVDVYKEMTLKVGWVNTDFIQNQFCVLAELRYHRYISDNRKKAIVNGNLGVIRALIDGGSGS